MVPQVVGWAPTPVIGDRVAPGSGGGKAEVETSGAEGAKAVIETEEGLGQMGTGAKVEGPEALEVVEGGLAYAD